MTDLIDIDVNIPISKFGQFYAKDFIIGVYEGCSKSENSNQYLTEFPEEISELTKNGFRY